MAKAKAPSEDAQMIMFMFMFMLSRQPQLCFKYDPDDVLNFDPDDYQLVVSEDSSGKKAFSLLPARPIQ